MNSTSEIPMENDTMGSPDVKVGISLVNACELIFGSLGILGNLICVVVFKRRSKHNQTNFLIIMQAAVDSIASALLIFLTITSIVNPKPPSNLITGSIYCKFWTSYVLLWSSFAISTFNLTIISIERYIAVVHPMWYAKIFKRSSVLFIAIFAWFTAPGINIAYNVIVNHFRDGACTENFDKAQKAISIVLFFWEYFFPMCIMTFSFVCIARTMLKMNKVSAMMSANATSNSMASQTAILPSHKSEASSSSCVTQKKENQQRRALCPARMNQSVTESVPENPTESQISVISNKVVRPGPAGCSSLGVSSNQGTNLDRFAELQTSKRATAKVPRSTRPAGASVRRLKTTKVLFLVSLGFFVCWSPNQIYFLLLNLGVIDFSLVPYRITIVMSTCNTCINPFIYALRMKTFRNEFLSIFKCRN
nr:delta-type opioid receptor-like [Lytechinus pictus]